MKNKLYLSPAVLESLYAWYRQEEKNLLDSFLLHLILLTRIVDSRHIFSIKFVTAKKEKI